MINVLIVDDSQIHLEGLKLIFRQQEGITITGEATNPQEAMQCLLTHTPDVAILDISLEKEMDGTDLAHEIRQLYPSVRIIFLSHHKKAKYLVNALKSGASAYLPKDTTPHELIHAVSATQEGKGIYFGETIPLSSLLDIFGSEKNLSKNKPYDLTNREIEIINYLARGYSAKELGSLLGIEVNSVESHKERIKEKLEVKSVVQIVVTAFRKGIIQL